MKTEALTYPGEALAPEWQRIELLGHLLAEARQGRTASETLIEELQQVQQRVEAGRSGCAWEGVRPAGLSPLELDVLACALAPEAEPRLGWLFQSLQPGAPQPYPTPALLQELLALAPEETPDLFAALGDDAPLRRQALIEIDGGDPFQPLRPGPGVSARLLGRPAVAGDLPGAILVRARAGWDDLILPPERIAMLREFLLWITHRRTVVEQWGGIDCGGPVALFSGPSGTGKTFAAAVLAGALAGPSTGSIWADW